MGLSVDYKMRAERLFRLAKEATTAGMRQTLQRRAEMYWAIAAGKLPPSAANSPYPVSQPQDRLNAEPV
jgi:hypothetical protein